jgi:hypothetical protein
MLVTHSQTPFTQSSLRTRASSHCCCLTTHSDDYDDVCMIARNEAMMTSTTVTMTPMTMKLTTAMRMQTLMVSHSLDK